MITLTDLPQLSAPTRSIFAAPLRNSGEPALDEPGAFPRFARCYAHLAHLARRALAAIALLLALGQAPALAATFTVTNTNSLGLGSFSQAVFDANANLGLDIIAFNIPSAGPHTIAPDPMLNCTPFAGAATCIDLTSPVVIDGYTQPGASPNTNPITQGSNAVLQIVLNIPQAIRIDPRRGRG